jgi:hypothetical protein
VNKKESDVCRAYLRGELEKLFNNTSGARSEILALMGKADSSELRWTGKYPTRRFPRRAIKA